MKKAIKVAEAKGKNLRIGPVRLTFAHILEPWTAPGDDPSKAKYQTGILIPQNEKKAVAAIEQCIEAAKKDGVTTKWKGRMPAKLVSPLNDGDEKTEAGSEFAGHFYINAKSTKRPSVVDRKFNPITDPDSIYSGCWALINVDFYPYDASGNRGVAVALNSVMKLYDDEQLGGGGPVNAQQAFSGVNTDIFDDDDPDSEDY